MCDETVPVRCRNARPPESGSAEPARRCPAEFEERLRGAVFAPGSVRRAWEHTFVIRVEASIDQLEQELVRLADDLVEAWRAGWRWWASSTGVRARAGGDFGAPQNGCRGAARSVRERRE